MISLSRTCGICMRDTLIRKSLCNNHDCGNFYQLPGALARAKAAQSKGAKRNKGRKHATGERIFNFENNRNLF